MSYRPQCAIVAISVVLLLLLITLPAAICSGSSELRLSKGQTVYVPAYSNVFSGPKALPFNLATILSIRNTDPATALNVTRIDYYDTNGKRVRSYLNKPVTLNPLATTYVYLEEKDTAGGFGASFIVEWDAGRVMNSPIIECLMIGASSGQGISFVSPGQVIKEPR